MRFAFFAFRVAGSCFVVSAFCRVAAIYASSGRLETADRIGFSGFGVGAFIIVAPWLWSGITRFFKRGQDA